MTKYFFYSSDHCENISENPLNSISNCGLNEAFEDLLELEIEKFLQKIVKNPVTNFKLEAKIQVFWIISSPLLFFEFMEFSENH